MWPNRLPSWELKALINGESEKFKPKKDIRLLMLMLCVIACLVLGISCAFMRRDLDRLTFKFKEQERDLEAIRKSLSFETNIEAAQSSMIRDAIKWAVKK